MYNADIRTDKHIFQVFSALPTLLLQLLGLPLSKACQYISMVVKAIHRECDGVLVYDEPEVGLYVTEWQFYFDAEIYNRIAIAMASLQNEYPNRPTC